MFTAFLSCLFRSLRIDVLPLPLDSNKSFRVPVYTSASDDDKVGGFCDVLESILIVKHTSTVVMGDFSIKLGEKPGRGTLAGMALASATTWMIESQQWQKLFVGNNWFWKKAERNGRGCTECKK